MYHYVYKLIHKTTKEFYIGSRSCKIIPEKDKYMGSSKTWNISKDIKLGNIKKIILKSNFKDRNEAIEYEAKIISKYINNKLNRNYHIPGNNFHTTGMVCVNIDNKTSLIPCYEYEKDVFSHINEGRHKNKVVVKDSNGNTSQVDIDDPRYLSGELVSINKGKIVVKNEDGSFASIDKNNSDYISGKIKASCKGKITVKDENGKHFMVDMDDPRYLSGELVHMRTGISPVNKGTPPILQIKDGIVVKEWKDLCELHETMHYNKSTILGWIKYGKKAKNGFDWKYKE